MLNRRSLIISLTAAIANGISSNTHAATDRIPLADAHSHLGLVTRTLRQADFIEQSKESGLSLISWCIVPDAPWLKVTSTGIVQNGSPWKGQVAFEFNKRLTDVKEYLVDKNIKIALNSDDVDAALAGDPRVILASEGADFAEGDLSKIAEAHKAGLRHTQLVHYIESDLGDLQTIAPKHGGLTAFGKSVIQECNKLGILVDLAHCDSKSVENAVQVSVKPLIWSHGWYSETQGKFNDPHGVLSRRMSWKLAKSIADKKGVIGLWSLGVSDKTLQQYPEYPISAGPNRRLATYASGMAQMVKELGSDHVCFGTDMEGVGPTGVVNYYRELRQVADLLSETGMSDADIFKVCIGNYARVLKSAMQV